MEKIHLEKKTYSKEICDIKLLFDVWKNDDNMTDTKFFTIEDIKDNYEKLK